MSLPFHAADLHLSHWYSTLFSRVKDSFAAPARVPIFLTWNLSLWSNPRSADSVQNWTLSALPGRTLKTFKCSSSSNFWVCLQNQKSVYGTTIYLKPPVSFFRMFETICILKETSKIFLSIGHFTSSYKVNSFRIKHLFPVLQFRLMLGLVFIFVSLFFFFVVSTWWAQFLTINVKQRKWKSNSRELNHNIADVMYNLN